VDRVRYVGEPVAMVITDDRYQGEDAAELVSVDYDALPAVVGYDAALQGGTLLFPAAETNVAISGGAPADDSAFEGCEVVVERTIENQRLAPVPMEGRAAAATWEDGKLTAWVSTQNAQITRFILSGVLGLDPGAIRVVAPDVEAVVRAHETNRRLARPAATIGAPRRGTWYVVAATAAVLLVAATATLIIRNRGVSGSSDVHAIHSQLAEAGPFLERVAGARVADSTHAAADVRDGKRLLAATRAQMDTLGASAVAERALLTDLEYALAEVVQGAAADPTDKALLAETLQRRALITRLRASLADDAHGDGN